MGKEVNVHATYKSQSSIIICKREEFLSKVCERFGIEAETILVYDAKTNMKVRPPEQLEDVMKVIIKKKNPKSRTKSSEGGVSVPPEDIQIDKIIETLTVNGALTGSERYFLMKKVTQFRSADDPTVRESDRPLTLAPSGIKRKGMRNIKLQVCPSKLVPMCSQETQTEDIITSDKNVKERVKGDKSKREAAGCSNPARVLPSTSRKRPMEISDDDEEEDAFYENKRLAITRKLDPVAARKLMDQLYDQRRSFILTQLPMVSFVKEKYPLLFSVNEVRNEIDRIFSHGTCDLFLKNISRFAKPILSMVKEDDPVLTLTKEKMRSYPTDFERKYALEVGSLLLLPTIMKEERGFIKLFGKSLDKDFSNLPYIETQAKLKELFFDEHLFKIYAEGVLLCEASDFKEAMLCLCGSFYIFNIEYPGVNWNMFSALERLYLEKSDCDTHNLNDYALQVIKSLHFKAQASEAKRKLIKC